MLLTAEPLFNGESKGNKMPNKPQPKNIYTTMKRIPVKDGAEGPKKKTPVKKATAKKTVVKRTTVKDRGAMMGGNSKTTKIRNPIPDI